MKQLQISDETHTRLMALCRRLEWGLDETLLQVIEDAEDLQTEMETGQARELESKFGWRGKDDANRSA